MGNRSRFRASAPAHDVSRPAPSTAAAARGPAVRTAPTAQPAQTMPPSPAVPGRPRQVTWRAWATKHMHSLRRPF